MTAFNRRTAGLLAISPLALAVMSANAATRVDLHQQNLPELQKAYSATVALQGIAPMAHARHERFVQTDSESRLLLLRRNSDGKVTNTRYQQTFRGIPVFGQHVLVGEDANGNVRTLFGTKVEGLAAEIPNRAPKLAAGTALAIGKRAGMGLKANGLRTENEKSELMVYVGDNGRARLAYVVSYFADAPRGGSPTRPIVIVDADTGRVLRQWENLQHAAIGTGPGGNLKTGQYEYGSGGKPFLDVIQTGSNCAMDIPGIVKTNNLNNGTSDVTAAYSYTCPRNTVKTINGAYSPLNDAHNFGRAVYAMYGAYMNTAPLTFQLRMRVHYSTNYENAFWNGSSMTFGDGGSTFYPLVGLDVSAHEVSHGYTEQQSGLIYDNQSGGMNEAFSDIAGEAAEYYLNGTNDFLVGAEIFKTAGEALRYMQNPPQDGISIDNLANYNDSINVHYSSGIYNKAFWKLATTSGWNTQTAFQAFARANRDYWEPNSTFRSGACGVEQAALDMGKPKADVTAAMAVVGVTCQALPPPPTPIALTKGVPVTGLSASAGEYLAYYLAVPAGATNLTFNTSGGTGDMDLYVKFGSMPTTTTYDCRSWVSGNNESCTFAAPQTGNYYVMLNAYTTFSGAQLVGDYVATNPGRQTYTNATDVNITDNATVYSDIAVASRTGNAPADAVVNVSILHTFAGDLRVNLIAPDGTAYLLHNRLGASLSHIFASYKVDLSSEALNGTWRLQVIDDKTGDVGKIDSWSITM